MSRAQITNLGDTVLHVFQGATADPSASQPLNPGDSITLDANADVHIADENAAGMKDRRAASQALTGRRSAEAGAQNARGPFHTRDQHAVNQPAPSQHHGVHVASSSPDGIGTKTDDGTDVPKNAVGEHVQGDQSEATRTRDTGKSPKSHR